MKKQLQLTGTDNIGRLEKLRKFAHSLEVAASKDSDNQDKGKNIRNNLCSCGSGKKFKFCCLS